MRLCIIAKQNSVTYSINEATVLPDQFSLVTQYKSDITNPPPAVLRFNASSGIVCTWDGEPSSEVEMPSGSSATLSCSRTEISKRGFVTVTTKSIATAPMSLPWGAFNEQGIPIDYLQEISAAYDEVKTKQEEFLAELERSRVRVESGLVGINDRILEVSTGCSAQDMRVVERRVNFSPAFETPPNVVAAVKMIDANAPVNNRLDVYADNISADGFTIKAQTWCDSSHYGVGISWIAHGK